MEGKQYYFSVEPIRAAKRVGNRILLRKSGRYSRFVRKIGKVHSSTQFGDYRVYQESKTRRICPPGWLYRSGEARCPVILSI